MAAQGSPSPERAEAPPRITLRRIFDGSFLTLVGLCAGAGIAVFWLKGEDAFLHAVHESWELFGFILPRLAAAMLIAAFAQVLMPREVISRLIGEKAGAKSVIIATLAGAITPGGPLTCFPVVVALYAAGANKGALVAYLSSWAMLGVQRVFAWEIPLLGEDIALLRIAASAALPVLAGMIALYLPIQLRLPDQAPRAPKDGG